MQPLEERHAPKPAGEPIPITVRCRLHGGATHGTATAMEARGAPGPAPGLALVLDVAGRLHRVPEAKAADCAIGDDGTLARDVSGWIFLDDPESRLPAQAAFLAEGRMRWLVLAKDGAAPPSVLADTIPGMDRNGLAESCPVLPSDYEDYGGGVERWADGDQDYPDCSSGCRWWRSLHDDETGHADGDWGVCTNLKGPRRGMLTWEHQAGKGCFESGPEEVL
jgi:hypothetical protein